MSARKRNVAALAMASILGLGLCVLFSGPLQAQPAEEGRLVEVAPGLFAIVEAGGNGNVAFLVTDEGVVVVDSGETPAAGRMIVSSIGLNTDKPIRYIILTHYHGDHTWGLESFPEAAIIIGHENVLRNMREIMAEEMKGYPAYIEGIRKNIEKLKNEGSPEVKREEERLAANLREYEPVKDARIVFPEITFDPKLVIHLGGQTIEVLNPGSTHTNGSSVVLFPNQKAIHMGDMLFVGSHPYIDDQAGSNTANWIRFLREVQGWDVEKVISGHGPVAGKDALGEQALYLEELRREVGVAIAKGMSLEAAQKSVTMEAYKNLKWANLLVPDVRAVYMELTAEKNK